KAIRLQMIENMLVLARKSDQALIKMWDDEIWSRMADIEKLSQEEIDKSQKFLEGQLLEIVLKYANEGSETAIGFYLSNYPELSNYFETCRGWALKGSEKAIQYLLKNDRGQYNLTEFLELVQKLVEKGSEDASMSLILSYSMGNYGLDRNDPEIQKKERE